MKIISLPAGFTSAVLLISGTMIGVGILALPVSLGLAGFFPGVMTMIGVAFLSWTSGVLLGERVMDRGDAAPDIVSLYMADLGPAIRWVVVPVYLLLFYALMVAFLTGAAGILDTLIASGLPEKAWLIAVFVFVSLLSAFGRIILLRGNNVIAAVMISAFLLLLFSSVSHITKDNLCYIKWSVLPLTLPVLVCTFSYQIVIPIVREELQGNRFAVHMASLCALLIALLMTASWFFVVAGSLPVFDVQGGPSLQLAYKQGLPATVPLAQLLRSPIITLSGLLFSLLAITTSYLGVGAGLSSFMKDILPFFRAKNHTGWLFAATFCPSLVMALLNPHIFLTMVDIVGGLGIIFLYGLLPTLAFMRHRARGHLLSMVLMSIMLILFAALFGIELAKVFGVVG
jgi:tyrosine-specific transport protein